MPAKKPIQMSAEWMAQFERALTHEVMGIAIGYAAKLVEGYQKGEGIEDLRNANDYAHGAILDTMQGIRTWDPGRQPPMPLMRHLCRVVYSRVYHDRQRYKRQRSVPYHALDLDDENSVEVAMSLQRDDERRRPEGQLILRDLHAKTYARLRDDAARKTRSEDLLALIGFLEVGITTEPAIRAATQWGEQRYQNARRRFETLVRRLPEELQEAVKDAVFRAPTATGAELRRARDINPDEEDELYERDGDDELADHYAPPEPAAPRGDDGDRDDEEGLS